MPITPKRANRTPAPGSRFLSDVLADNLRAVRSTLGLNQRELAERMCALGHESWSRATVSEIERGGRNVSFDEMASVSAVLGVDVLRLLDPAGGDQRRTEDLNLGGFVLPVIAAQHWLAARVRIRVSPGAETIWIEPVEGHDDALAEAISAYRESARSKKSALPKGRER